MSISKKLISSVFLIASVGIYALAYADDPPNCPSVNSVKHTILTTVQNDSDDYDSDYTITGDLLSGNFSWKVNVYCEPDKESEKILSIAQQYLSKVKKRSFKKAIDGGDYWVCGYHYFPHTSNDVCEQNIEVHTPHREWLF